MYHEEDEAFYVSLSCSRSNKLIFLDISAPPAAHKIQAACAATCSPLIMSAPPWVFGIAKHSRV